MKTIKAANNKHNFLNELNRLSAVVGGEFASKAISYEAGRSGSLFCSTSLS